MTLEGGVGCLHQVLFFFGGTPWLITRVTAGGVGAAGGDWKHLDADGYAALLQLQQRDLLHQPAEKHHGQSPSLLPLTFPHHQVVFGLALIPL